MTLSKNNGKCICSHSKSLSILKLFKTTNKGYYSESIIHIRNNIVVTSIVKNKKDSLKKEQFPPAFN